MITKVALPSQPSVTPRRSTILDVGSVSTEFAGIDGYEAFWLSYNSMTFRDGAAFCAPNVKDFDQAAIWTSGFRFAVYGGLVCKTIGLNQAEMLSETERAFNTGEATAVERAVMSTRFAADTEEYAGDPMDRWDAPADLTPAGGAVSPKVGIALLEAWIADSYVGVGTLHLPIAIVSLLMGVGTLEFKGDTMVTGQGTKIVAGAGYDYPNLGPDGDSADSGELWIYVSGEVWVGKGPVQIKQSLENSTNEVFVLGERGYIVAVDGPVAAIRVKVE